MPDAREENNIELESIASEDEDRESSIPVHQIMTYPADYTLDVLNQKWLNGEIQLPSFQRDFVWSQTQSSKLIESFLVGLPVPAVYLYNERNSQKYLIIDGQQRLKSIFYFFAGYFGPPKNGRKPTFKLTGLSDQSEFVGKAFEALHEEDQSRLKNATLRTFTVRQLDPTDNDSMYQIFERLNTGGTSLTSQEIRNCVYHGKLAKFLQEINMQKGWREILGQSGLDSRRRDVELILRFFAMLDITQYKKPMKIFLNDFMKENRNLGDDGLNEMRCVFEETCNAVVDKLPQRPFHVRTGLNVAVLDAVMVAFAGNLTSIPNNIEKRFEELIHDDQFEQYTRSNTTDDRVVKLRFQRANQRLFCN